MDILEKLIKEKDQHKKNLSAKVGRPKEYDKPLKVRVLENNKEHLKCPCGGKYKPWSRSRHFKTFKHIEFVKKLCDLEEEKCKEAKELICKKWLVTNTRNRKKKT